MILSRWFKLDKGVQKSREGVFARIASVFEQPRPIDDHLWDELEDLLLQADVGVHTTDQLLEILRNEVELGNATSSKDLYRLLREELVLSLTEVAPATPEEMLAPDGQLGVLLVVGVTGSVRQPALPSWRTTGSARGGRSCWRPATPSGRPRSNNSSSGASGSTCR